MPGGAYMKKCILVVAFLMLLNTGYGKTEPGQTKVFSLQRFGSVQKTWSLEGVLKIPESVMYDSKNDLLYVSNINGGSTEKNGKGFISKISIDGNVIALEWITGLNAPKGMGILGDELFVTDVDRFHIIDIPIGKVKKTVVIHGAQFLNDIAIGNDGYVYITDMSTKMIHRFDKVNTEKWLILKDYSRPNGLFIKDSDLYIGTAEGILKCSTADGSVKMFVEHNGGIDGIKAAGENSFIVSDWKGRVQVIGRDKDSVLLFDTSEKKINAADFEYVETLQMIFVPTFNGNGVTAYRIK